MKRKLPLLGICLGVLLIFGGFMYDVMFAGIPYQDPSPEMTARYALHSRIASTICALGAGAFLAGAVAGLMQLVVRRFSKNKAA